MEKQNKSEKIKEIIFSQKKHIHTLKRRNKKYNPLKISYPKIKTQNKKGVPSYEDLIVPEKLNLKELFLETVNFLEDLKIKGDRSEVQIRLFFDNCQQISPTAMLLLLAHIHRIRLLRGSKALTGTYPTDEKLKKRMSAMGFFDLLGIKSPLEVTKTFPMEYIKFKSDTKNAKGVTKNFRNDLFGDEIVVKTPPSKGFYRSITEAILNCIEHAYPDTKIKDKKIKGRWWLCGHYHKPSKKLHVMFCDLGVGIPKTLPRTHGTEKIRAVLSYLKFIPGIDADDGLMIQAGMNIGRTSTQKSNRGKGLNDLKKFITIAGEGVLMVYSNKGVYNYRLGHDGTIDEKSETKSRSINGTLIYWNVPIQNIADYSEEY